MNALPQTRTAYNLPKRASLYYIVNFCASFYLMNIYEDKVAKGDRARTCLISLQRVLTPSHIFWSTLWQWQSLHVRRSSNGRPRH